MGNAAGRKKLVPDGVAGFDSQSPQFLVYFAEWGLVKMHRYAQIATDCGGIAPDASILLDLHGDSYFFIFILVVE